MASRLNETGEVRAGDRHMTDLDGMRGVLAVGVMLFHFGSNTIIEKVTSGRIVESQWQLCVDFFFILSGFVLSASFSRRRPALADYFSRRTRRLAPLYILTCAAMISPISPSCAIAVPGSGRAPSAAASKGRLRLVARCFMRAVSSWPT